MTRCRSFKLFNGKRILCRLGYGHWHIHGLHHMSFTRRWDWMLRWVI